MPRLAGKQTNTGWIIVVAVVMLLAMFLVLEYFGTIDLVPNFGQPSVAMLETLIGLWG